MSGNTTLDAKRMSHLPVNRIFAWGKHLVIQFPDFALRTHFLLFGSFEAVINGERVTGDYERTRTPRLKLAFKNGELAMFNCSVKWIERNDARKEYDFSIDIMSRQWDAEKALTQLGLNGGEEIADVLLDQDVFAGVGNIIKNEVLWLAQVHPSTRVKRIRLAERKRIVTLARSFPRQFLQWRRKFVLRKNLSVYGRKVCQRCGGEVKRMKTGKRERWSYICLHCQPRA